MQDRRAPQVRKDTTGLFMIVPDNQFKAGVSVCKVMTGAGVTRICWPESHRALALECLALLSAGTAPAQLKQPLQHPRADLVALHPKSA